MGKKKKKIQERISNMDPIYSQEVNEQIADAYESYCNVIDTFIIVEGRNKQSVEDSLKVIRKAIKNLREGKPEKVFDRERYEAVMEYYNKGDFHNE